MITKDNKMFARIFKNSTHKYSVVDSENNLVCCISRDSMQDFLFYGKPKILRFDNNEFMDCDLTDEELSKFKTNAI